MEGGHTEKYSVKRKKVGMLTFHQCHNYGAMLCAYALQGYIQSIGYETEYINIENEIFWEFGKKTGHQLYRRCDSTAVMYRERYQEELKKRWKFFEDFKNTYLRCSEAIHYEDSMEELMNGWGAGRYDVLLVGGDQLWNEELLVSQDIFVLPFQTECSKISFGTSMGASENMSLYRRMFLRKFAAIGVRETYAAEYIRKYTGVPAVVTVDPVFLLEKEEWEKFCEYPKEDHYIFAFLFNTGEEEFSRRVKQLCQIAERCGTRILFCASDMTREAEALDVRIDVRPREWLGYLSKAEFVITNSFHGVAFSLIFEKNFICLDMDRRKEELLSACNLSDRLQIDLSEYECMKEKEIDYVGVKKHLKDKINVSQEFLKYELNIK